MPRVIKYNLIFCIILFAICVFEFGKGNEETKDFASGCWFGSLLSLLVTFFSMFQFLG